MGLVTCFLLFAVRFASSESKVRTSETAMMMMGGRGGGGGGLNLLGCRANILGTMKQRHSCDLYI